MALLEQEEKALEEQNEAEETAQKEKDEADA